MPTSGLVANVPPHLAPPTSLIDGYNVYLDIDGKLKVRSGYSPVPNGPLQPIDYPNGIVNYHDAATDLYFTVVQGRSTWQYYNASASGPGSDWTNITGSQVVNGQFNIPGRFTTFWQNGQTYVYGVNGSSPLFYWYEGLPAIIPVQSAPTTAFDVNAIANRLILIHTVEDGLNYPYRVRWSAVDDGTTWPVDAFADLQGSSDDMDFIVATRALNRLTSAIYRENSIWIMTAQAGTDATAFDFELAPNSTGINGPANPSCIVNVNGIHYYFGTDGRIWTFDGINCYPISAAIDPVLVDSLQPISLRDRQCGIFGKQTPNLVLVPNLYTLVPQPTPWYSPVPRP